MNDNKTRQTRSVINGAPIANPARKPVARPSADVTAKLAGGTRPAVAPVTKPVAANRPASTASVQPQVNHNSSQQRVAVERPEALQAAQSKPTQPVSNPTKPVSSSKQPTKPAGKGNSKKKLWIGICGVALVIILVVVAIVLAMNANKGDKGNSDNTEGNANNNAIVDADSEEVKRVTQETIDKYAEVKVEGYKDMEGEDASGKAVVVTVKNTSEETVSLAITIGAYDSEGNLLETSSMYAEGIQPGQTSLFNTFVFTELTPEQLANASYKVYTANTYDTPQSNETEANATVETEAVVEQPAE